MTTTAHKHSAYAKKRGVQKMYTEDMVLRDIRAKKGAGKSLRDIAADYENITHADIQRILRGEFPHTPHKRAALGLPPMLPAPACAKCGQVHVTRNCTQGRSKPRRWVRVYGHEGWRNE